jgi:hypothetical protein
MKMQKLILALLAVASISSLPLAPLGTAVATESSPGVQGSLYSGMKCEPFPPLVLKQASLDPVISFNKNNASLD